MSVAPVIVDICLVCRCENLSMGAGRYTAWEGSLIPMCGIQYCADGARQCRCQAALFV